jgi:ATP-dependent DNA helicase RecQ
MMVLADSGLDERLRDVLRRVWGFTELKPLQLEAMRAVAAGRDSLVVLPTGGGKSLCYQAPALLERGLAVVVSPLISLMKDQVDGLKADGVPAECLHSGLEVEARREVVGRLRAGELALLYVAPERLVGEGGAAFQELLAERGVRFFAVDEAHCISQWGHDFRPEYRGLRALRERFPGASLHAFTATATPRVRRDILEQLALRDPEVLVGDFDRPNLTYRARHRGDLGRALREALERHRGEAGIVYCITRREVDRLAVRLADEGWSALPYHAGLTDAERHRHQDAFLEERSDVVVATVAFGMGIDRPDVRFVLHTASPRSLEHYQQEAGRAGRDGLPAECLLLYSAADFAAWRRLLERDGTLDERAQRLLADMWAYAAATRCRHRALAEYFGQAYPAPSCGACDWCLGELEAVEEPTVLAQKILSGVLRLKESFGTRHLLDMLRGQGTDRVRELGHDRLSTFGLLAHLPPAELRGYVEQLLEGELLETSGERYPVLRVTAAGRRLLKGETSCTLYRQHVPRREPAPQRAIADSWDGVDRELFEALRELRRELAAERGVPPYVILHDRSLRDLARLRPATRAELLAVHGIGQAKADAYGAQLLAAIRRLRGTTDPD